MLGPVGMLVQAASEDNEDIASRAGNVSILRMSAVIPLLLRLGRDSQPSVRAFFHIGIITLRVAAVVPVAGCLSLRRNLHDLPLLDVYGWRRGGRNNRRIAV